MSSKSNHLDVIKNAMINRAFEYLDFYFNGKADNFSKDADIMCDIYNIIMWAKVNNLYISEEK